MALDRQLERGWAAEAVAMKRANPALTLREIGEALGHSSSAVWKALNPDVTRERNASDREKRRAERRATDRARSQHQRSRCDTCGELCGIGSARWKGHEAVRCKQCRSKVAEEREDRIVALYESGVPLKEIAAAVGWTVGGLSRRLAGLRRAGRIGYRYVGWAEKAE